jgi:preprotein translocase subunit SecA
MRFLPPVLRRLWVASFRARLAPQTMARFMLYLAQQRAEHLAYKQRKASLENEIETEKSMI